MTKSRDSLALRAERLLAEHAACRDKERRIEIEDELSTFTPNKKSPCHDCGSTLPGRHTESCDMALPSDRKDLPQRPGSQHWTKEVPK